MATEINTLMVEGTFAGMESFEQFGWWMVEG
jgi:hypothetical protein